MPTYKLIIAYDGTRYCGWQTQAGRNMHLKSASGSKTIQGEIEAALKKIFAKRVKIEGSGRTDSGVHATAQVAHFCVKKDMDPSKLVQALNGIIGPDIRIDLAEKTRRDFHARYDVARKSYRYLIFNSNKKPLFVRDLVAWVKYPLDISSMRKAARFLLGEHDFTSFKASERSRRSCRTKVYGIRIKKLKLGLWLPFLGKDEWIVIDVTASGFLRNMVRNIVGTLIEVGRRRIKPEEMRRILKEKDRRSAGPCAPSAGLYLSDVAYD